jgi:hypothetical protein
MAIKVVKRPETGTNFIQYETTKKSISFNDEELAINLEKRERDDDVTLDICKDYQGGLTLGTESARAYVAQVFIPARQYTEVEDTVAEDTETATGTAEARTSGTGSHLEPVKFDISRCTLYLYEQEGEE